MGQKRANFAKMRQKLPYLTLFLKNFGCLIWSNHCKGIVQIREFYSVSYKVLRNFVIPLFRPKFGPPNSVKKVQNFGHMALIATFFGRPLYKGGSN